MRVLKSKDAYYLVASLYKLAAGGGWRSKDHLSLQLINMPPLSFIWLSRRAESKSFLLEVYIFSFFFSEP